MADIEGCPPFAANGLPSYTLVFRKVQRVDGSDRELFTIAGLTKSRLEEIIAAGEYAGMRIRRIYLRKGLDIEGELVWSGSGKPK